MLVVDAFSGDSIPIHLLTAEALDIYLQDLRNRDAVLAFHVSNRYLDLRPLVGLREHAHLSATEVFASGSKWILLSAKPGHVATSQSISTRQANCPDWPPDSLDGQL